MAERNELKYLMSRFADNTCTREEFDRLLALIGSADEDEELTDEMRKCWDSIGAHGPLSAEWRERFANMLDSSARPEPAAVLGGTVRRLNLRKWLVAAAVLLSLTAGYLGHRGRETRPVAQGGMVPTKTKTAGVLAVVDRNRAVLTLADGSVIELDTAARGTIAMQGNVKIIKAAQGEITYHPGGGALVEGFNTIVTPKGGKYCVVLPDGTKVWLNAASSLRFPTGLERGTRAVTLTGEAFFEVARNSRHPFVVKAGNIAVEVLGTMFNVNAYREEGRVSTTLLQGKIRVVKSSDGAGSAGVLLKPGIRATLADNGTLTLDQAPNMDEVLAWKNGNFNFVNTPVPEILREIARWYDLEIVYEGAPPDKQLTGTFSRSVDLDQLTNMLRYAGVNMRIEKNRLLILPN
jgi:ferric-dicitrate binding protein FerR (iron transport regulator)